MNEQLPSNTLSSEDAVALLRKHEGYILTHLNAQRLIHFIERQQREISGLQMGQPPTVIVSTGPEPEPVPPKEPSPEWVQKARAEGRAEFLAILLGESAEDFPQEYMGSHPIGDTGDYGTHWEVEKLRATFAVDDATYSYIDNINGMWWSQQHEIETLQEQLQGAAQPPDHEREIPMGSKVQGVLATHIAGTVVAIDTRYEIQGDNGEFWTAWHRELEVPSPTKAGE